MSDWKSEMRAWKAQEFRLSRLALQPSLPHEDQPKIEEDHFRGFPKLKVTNAGNKDCNGTYEVFDYGDFHSRRRNLTSHSLGFALWRNESNHDWTIESYLGNYHIYYNGCQIYPSKWLSESSEYWLGGDREVLIPPEGKYAHGGFYACSIAPPPDVEVLRNQD